MEAYLKDVNELATCFAQFGQPKPSSEINDWILAGLGEDWEPLILSLTPMINSMTMNDL